MSTIDDVLTEKDLFKHGFKKLREYSIHRIQIMERKGKLYAMTVHYDSGIGNYYKIIVTNAGGVDDKKS